MLRTAPLSLKSLCSGNPVRDPNHLMEIERSWISWKSPVLMYWRSVVPQPSGKKGAISSKKRALAFSLFDTSAILIPYFPPLNLTTLRLSTKSLSILASLPLTSLLSPCREFLLRSTGHRLAMVLTRWWSSLPPPPLSPTPPSPPPPRPAPRRWC